MLSLIEYENERMSRIKSENILHRERAVQKEYFEVSDRQKKKWSIVTWIQKMKFFPRSKVVHNIKGYQE